MTQIQSLISDRGIRKSRCGILYVICRRINLIACMLTSILTMIIMTSVFMVIYSNTMSNMELLQEQKITQLNSEWEQKLLSLEESHKIIYDGQLDDIEQLQTDLSSALARVQELQEVGEAEFDILNEYWYVFKYAGDNSGLTVDLIKYVDTMCKEWNVNPHWMWSIYWVESRFNTNIDNTAGSGARGLGQVMPSTGRSFWENVFNNGDGSFYTDMLYDPYVNVQITTAIIGRHLSNGWSMYDAVNQYSGGGGDDYYNKLITAGNDILGVSLNTETPTYPG